MCSQAFHCLVTPCASLFPVSSKESYLYGSARLLLWQRGESQVRLDDLQVGPDVLGVFGLDAGVDDDVLTGTVEGK